MWKPLAFLGIAIAAAGLGFTWHAIADPNRAQAVPTNMSIAIYETDPGVPLSVDGYLIPAGHLAQESDEFYFTVRADSTAPNSVVIISNQPLDYSPYSGSGVALPSVQEASGDASASLHYLLFRPTTSSNTITAGFRAPGTVRIDGQDGDTAAALPSISGHAMSNIPGDPLELMTGYRLEQDTVYEDIPHDSPDTSDIIPYTNVETPDQLRMPKSLTITERLIGGAEGLGRSDIKQDLPATGGVKGPDFVWQSDSGMSPTLVAVSRTSEQDYASDEFRSGVAFAISAAALIALLQEGPTRVLRRRSRRLAGAQAAEGDSGTPPPLVATVPDDQPTPDDVLPAEAATPAATPDAAVSQHDDTEQADDRTPAPDPSDGTSSEPEQPSQPDPDGQPPLA